MPRVSGHAPGTFAWIELGTTDAGAAKAFYDGLFGWSHRDDPMGPSGSYTTFLMGDGSVAGGYQLNAEQQKMGVPPHWMLYVGVESADASAEKAKAAGGTVILPAFDVFDFGRMAVLKDPAGAVISVWESKTHIGTTVVGEPGTACWADLMTSDPEAAKAFYGAVFGWQFEAGKNDTSGYLHIQAGKEMIGGMPPKGHLPPGVPPHWMLYFLVNDTDATTAKAKASGGRAHMEPSTMPGVGRISVLADPQGAVFALFQPISG